MLWTWRNQCVEIRVSQFGSKWPAGAHFEVTGYACYWDNWIVVISSTQCTVSVRETPETKNFRLLSLFSLVWKGKWTTPIYVGFEDSWSLQVLVSEDTLVSNADFDEFKSIYEHIMGRHSSVGIATRYGLDGPGIESRWGRDFPHLSRPALGPTQPPSQWVPGSRG